MAVYCGTDIVEIERIKESIETHGQAFRDRVFTEREIEYCEGKKAAKYQSYAARFAAKEAVSKALGTGITEKIGWKDIEILNNEHGKPEVHFSQKGKQLFERLGGKSISISLSHCKNYAVSYAVIEASTGGADERD